MSMHRRLFACVACAVSLLAFSALSAGGDPESLTNLLSSEQIDFFESRIRPVLVEHCYECHSTEAQPIQAGLLLDVRDAMREGGDSGVAVVPGDVNASLLIEALRYESLEMPPSGRLPDEVIADFSRWVEMGAPDPREQRREQPAVAATVPAAANIDWAVARQHWAFRAPQRHRSPDAPDPWGQRPLDAFVLEALHKSQLSPSPPADRRTLIRRVTFDLIGLPPTPEQVEQFTHADDPASYEQLVESLLASPHYGEHWASMWMDLMRYAEDQAHIVGNNRELCYPNAYLYRDWLIDSLNEDLPYDEFIRLQLAADLVKAEDEAAQRALGFLGLGPKYYQRKSAEVMAEEWENQVDTVTRGLLGLTVACARCHDHKYDPIPTEDYYALAGVFAGTEMFNRPRSEEVEQDKLGAAKSPDDAVHVVREGSPRALQVMIRGDVSNLGPLVPRRFLRVLSVGEPEVFSQAASGRGELAEAIVARNNPLTARVIVNRIWARHLGRPLVGTPSNYGTLGEPPTHPELLDDLAVRFMDNGWSLKWLHREIVMSATYQQASVAGADPRASRGREVDPANALWWRMNRKRLTVEQWRDAVLAATGELDASVGGPSLDPSDPAARRRTVYAERSRFQLNSMLSLFDFPDPNAHAARRNETTTPLQKLFLMNGPFLVRQADLLAAKLEEMDSPDDVRIAHLYQLLFERAPADEELQLGESFLRQAEGLSWSEYAQALLASNEMLIID